MIISRKQLEELEDTLTENLEDFNRILEKYTGIKARPYTDYLYYDSNNNFIGDGNNFTLSELLENAYIEVGSDA